MYCLPADLLLIPLSLVQFPPFRMKTAHEVRSHPLQLSLLSYSSSFPVCSRSLNAPGIFGLELSALFCYLRGISSHHLKVLIKFYLFRDVFPDHCIKMSSLPCPPLPMCVCVYIYFCLFPITKMEAQRRLAFMTLWLLLHLQAKNSVQQVRNTRSVPSVVRQSGISGGGQLR